MADEDLAALKKARSLLMILLATCRETLLALQAADNSLDATMTSELSAMIDRSETELQALSAKIKSLEN